MKTYLLFFFLLAALFFGYKAGKNPEEKIALDSADKTMESPVTMRKTFVFVVYAYNQSLWINRTLLSIFEQEYDYYRIIFIDDGSKDNTFALAKELIQENNQESKTLLIRNEKKLGFLPCLHQVVHNLLDQEIMIPIQAKDWLAHSGALTRMNAVFQNPNVWTASASGISYPSFEKCPLGLEGFYAALFKQLSSKDFLEKDLSIPLQKLSKGKTAHIRDVLCIANMTSP